MRIKFTVIATIALIIYFVLHLSSVTGLPVFADEAIYIRWAQLIIEHGGDFWFFPLNDGKTPLFIWLLVPLQKVFTDPLYAGRMASILVGAVEILLMASLVKEAGGKRTAQTLSMLFTILLPFWFFHYHVALIDGLLVLWLTISLWAAIRVQKKKTKKQLFWLSVLGFSFGLALLTKIPAVLFSPILLLTIVLPKKRSVKKRLRWSLCILVSLLGGVMLFGLLKFHPAFGQLFNRGGDFLFPVSQVLQEGLWWKNFANVPSYIGYFWNYLTPGLCIVMLIGLFARKRKWTIHWFFWAGWLFILPIAIMGKVVYARYLVPAIIPFTVAASIAFEHFLFTAKTTKMFERRVIVSTFLAVLLAHVVVFSLSFVTALLATPDSTPFVSSDRQQYLEEWSSGHGIIEVTHLIKQQAERETIAVATEGYFGTLPDGILMYLHDQDVTNIRVEGIGQPVGSLPTDFIDQAQSFDTIWLVVNSHRLTKSIDEDKLVTEFCRPNGAPCLQVWDVSEQVHQGLNF